MSNSFEKIPAFNNQSPTSVINEVAARLVVFPDPLKAYQSGSCCRISKNLYITAAHVVRDWVEKFGSQSVEQHFEIWAIHVRNGPEYSIWTIDHIWINPFSDLALLHTHPYNDIAAAEKSTASVILNLLPPKCGEQISGFGHHSPTQNIILDDNGTRHIEIDGLGAATTGEVKEVHHEKRDATRLSFPCFQVNSRFDGGMSGGPVFNSNGHLCRVICSNLPPSDDKSEHVSYVTTLWPLMATYIDISADGTNTNQPYPLIELARQGVLTALGHEMVRIIGSMGTMDFRVEIDKH